MSYLGRGKVERTKNSSVIVESNASFEVVSIEEVWLLHIFDGKLVLSIL